MRNPSKRVTVRADRQSMDGLDGLAADLGMSRSDLLRDLIAEVAKNPPPCFSAGPLPEVQVIAESALVERARAAAKAAGHPTLNAAILEALRVRLERRRS